MVRSCRRMADYRWPKKLYIMVFKRKKEDRKTGFELEDLHKKAIAEKDLKLERLETKNRKPGKTK